MNHRQHADAAERRLEAVQGARHRLAELADEPNKTPAMWAEVSELKLNLQLAYDGAGVHAGLAVHGVLEQLVSVLAAAMIGLDREDAQATVRRLADQVLTPRPERAGMAPDERRRAAQRDSRPGRES